MPEELIAAIKADPNIPMVTDQQVFQLIASGKLDKEEIMLLLKEPRLSIIKRMMADWEAQHSQQDREEKRKKLFKEIKEGVGRTIEDIKNFIQQYPETPEAFEAKKILEKRCFEACHDLESCRQFQADYPDSVYDIKEKIRKFEEAAALKEAENRAKEMTDWSQAKSQAIAGDEKTLSEFIANAQHQNFLLAKDPDMDVTRREWAESMIKSITDYPYIKQTIDNVLNSPDSDVDNYVYLMQNYPMFRDYIHKWMLTDMKTHAERYQRHEIRALLYGGNLIFRDKQGAEESINPYFGVEEMLNNNILTEQQVQWIFSHPTIQSDYERVELPIEDNFKVAPNTTDVYFFGVPGCGKTSVLAGLFSAYKIEDNLTFTLPSHSNHKGFNYARSLVTSLEDDLFPRSTPVINQRTGEEGVNDNDDKFIQVIDAILTEKGTKTDFEHKISLIEMPGARTNELASIGKTDDLDVLGTGAKELLSNDNNKIIFFVIDPKNTRKQPVIINGKSVNLRQSGTLDIVANLIKRMLNGNKITNLKAVHVILAKSDLLPSQSEAAIQQVLADGAYEPFLNTLKDICHERLGEVNIHCGRMPHLFTFSLGHIAPGDFVKYDDKDTKKILKVICANTMSIRSKNFWDTLMTWMN